MNTYRDAIIEQGPCAFCGHPFAAHRAIDSQIERVSAGEPLDHVAADWDEGVVSMLERWLALTELENERGVKHSWERSDD
jgi:hypothetical protein